SSSNGPIAHHGRKDLRALLIEAAQSLLDHKNPLFAWGYRMKMRKGRNVAVVALARKLVVAIWYLLQGMFTPLMEIDQTLRVKIRKLAVALGLPTLKKMGFPTSKAFQDHLMNQLLTSTS